MGLSPLSLGSIPGGTGWQRSEPVGRPPRGHRLPWGWAPTTARRGPGSPGQRAEVGVGAGWAPLWGPELVSSQWPSLPTLRPDTRALSCPGTVPALSPRPEESPPSLREGAQPPGRRRKNGRCPAWTPDVGFGGLAARRGRASLGLKHSPRACGLWACLSLWQVPGYLSFPCSPFKHEGR